MNPVTQRKAARILALRSLGLTEREIAEQMRIALKDVTAATALGSCSSGANLNLGDPTRPDRGLRRFSFIEDGRWAKEDAR